MLANFRLGRQICPALENPWARLVAIGTLGCLPYTEIRSHYWSRTTLWSLCFAYLYKWQRWIFERHIHIFQDISKSLSTDQEDWSSFTSADGKLNHGRLTTDGLGNHESSGEFVRASTYSPANSSAILNLYKGSERVDDVVIAQGSAESVQSSSDLFSNNEMVSIHHI